MLEFLFFVIAWNGLTTQYAFIINAIKKKNFFLNVKAEQLIT